MKSYLTISNCYRWCTQKIHVVIVAPVGKRCCKQHSEPLGVPDGSLCCLYHSINERMLEYIKQQIDQKYSCCVARNPVVQCGTFFVLWVTSKGSEEPLVIWVTFMIQRAYFLTMKLVNIILIICKCIFILPAIFSLKRQWVYYRIK